LACELAPEVAVDFGCGAGRVAIPLAKLAGAVVGVDVSPSMLREAETNSRSRSATNIEWSPLEPFLASNRTFDFIHSYIVFRHVPIARGEQLFRTSRWRTWCESCSGESGPAR